MTTNQRWQTLSTTNLLDRSPWLRVQLDHVRLPNGVEITDFHRVEMRDWTQVVAVTDDGRVPMLELYRHGPGVQSLELPAGYVDDGETPEATMRRELLEEAGVEAATWHHLGSFFIDGNRGCGATHIFLARGARQVRAPEHEASEVMTLRWLSLADVRAAWLAGRLPNVGTVAAVGLALAQLEGEQEHAADSTRTDG
jgi:ADP-ribose pyrophosphatase